MVTAFDSFNASGFDAFIESAHAARGADTPRRALMWPSRQEDLDALSEPYTGKPDVMPAYYLSEDYGVRFDAVDTWTGNSADYDLILHQPVNTAFRSRRAWYSDPLPSWYTDIQEGKWSGRIFLDVMYGGFHPPYGASSIGWVNRLAADFGIAVVTSASTCGTVLAPHHYLIGVPTDDNQHWLFDGVSRLGYWHIATRCVMGEPTPALTITQAAPIRLQIGWDDSYTPAVPIMRAYPGVVHATRRFDNGNVTEMFVSSGVSTGRQVPRQVRQLGDVEVVNHEVTREDASRFAYNLMFG